eukprot:4812435-Heterocapsa_arctica.AAC.1
MLHDHGEAHAALVQVPGVHGAADDDVARRGTGAVLEAVAQHQAIVAVDLDLATQAMAERGAKDRKVSKRRAVGHDQPGPERPNDLVHEAL